MGGTLFGQEQSGTPIETRGATEDLGKLLQSIFSGGGGGRMRSDAVSQLLGFDPSAGLGEAASSALADPRDVTRGLFTALDAEQRRQSDRIGADLLESFGRMGTRFSSNAAREFGNVQADLNTRFNAQRQQGLLQAAGQRNQALASLLGVNSQFTSDLMRFLSPGAPNWQEGIMGDILAAAGAAAGGR